MNAIELIKRIADLEERCARAEYQIKALEMLAGKAEDVASQDGRLQSLEDWRETFTKPKRPVLTTKLRNDELQKGACSAPAISEGMQYSFAPRER